MSLASSAGSTSQTPPSDDDAMSANLDADARTLEQTCVTIAEQALRASRALVSLDAETKNQWLRHSADALINATDEILTANEIDLSAAETNGLDDAMIDRLRLTPQRIEGIADGLREVAALPDPIGEVLDGFNRPGELRIIKRRVPLGVVFFIYESRPNVTADAAAICVKSGNAVILRGGKEAMHSSRAIVQTLDASARSIGLPPHSVQLVQTTDRAAVGHFLKMDQFIDVTIPRGGEGLIRRVAAEATMPVIKHYDGNCHVYVDAEADVDMAVKVIENAKCQRMGVCNACESLLVHQSISDAAIVAIADKLFANGITIVGDAASRQIDSRIEAATDEDYAAEYLGPKISVKVVDDIESAIDHINHFGSHHSDAIVTNDMAAAQRFSDAVDSSAVMINASTRFNDGGVFGLGAEIGISTDKFHARGPCGIRELTTYKYIVTGNGSIRQ